ARCRRALARATSRCRWRWCAWSLPTRWCSSSPSRGAPGSGSLRTARRSRRRCPLSKRRKLDLYETGRHAVDALLRRVDLGPSVLEPCAGRGAIVNPIVHTGRHVFSGDLNPEFDPAGASRDALWWVERHELSTKVDVVTNPPFSEANRIVPAFVRAGHRCAFLLRLSWLEPT